MRWQGKRESANVEDRRGQRPMMRRGAGIGCGGLLLVGLLLVLTGNDPTQILQLLAGLESADVSAPMPTGLPDDPSAAPSDQLGRFASVVLADTEDTWHALLDSSGQSYKEPTLVLFSERVQSACGFSSAAVGPFYCPLDRQVYLDLAFFDELERRFGAPGDFGQAYVIAHEVGHHVQNLLGIADEVERMQQVSRGDARELSVRMELQADCLAGVWGHHAAKRGLLEAGDLEEGLRAAAAIGDDQIQRRMQGYVVPESFTHGSSEQRVHWFAQGAESGQPGACETFGGGGI